MIGASVRKETQATEAQIAARAKMAVADYRKYLAENVLNERRTVTYRSLGRALKVHGNLAKQMLYDFHHTENKKKPQSVNATYIITGTRKPQEKDTSGVHTENHDDGDDAMQGSPFLPSSMPNQDAASDEDLNVLTDVHREMLAAHAHEDPLEYGKQWGMIQNKNVKRRTGMRPPAAAPTPAPKSAAPSKRPSQEEATQKVKSESKKAEDAAPTSQPKPEEKPPVKPSAKTAPLKREKSDLFSSFAKAKPKQKKEGSATPAVSGAESAEPSGAEDVVLGDASDEEEPEELFPDSGKSSTANNRETRKQREERLRKMMEDEDDDDEEMADVPEPPAEEEKTIDQPPPKEEPREEITVSGGRRRGRRKVMKKKTVKDEEGYLGENLLTVEEPSWESFSEDEPAPPPKKKPALSAPKGKAGGKAGQGNIMSFFSKK
ncbi:hypothetical protein CNMCM6936_009031 [Aspergillus lentulus]|uniref:DNA polymerase delta subunit 3 n=1 Tax=Aspergillus lentulus TaxID=293939 RepID=A0AAN5YGF8_ASPLE|nr:hypothetical protein CNMCM6069_007974 [Aspergillus lentulus]KAF4164537.1 hypothetical protein CNMCM6936_009031 [Aspergillus lentulus]KAF4185746.1 hypothetical protein CNMCM7927_006304 [Aspergillus lentulus]KAF4201081.1 hypothetical protein CNMCM8927_002064 [Aspergillus lentulus]